MRLAINAPIGFNEAKLCRIPSFYVVVSCWRIKLLLAILVDGRCRRTLFSFDFCSETVLCLVGLPINSFYSTFTCPYLWVGNQFLGMFLSVVARGQAIMAVSR